MDALVETSTEDAKKTAEAVLDPPTAPQPTVEPSAVPPEAGPSNPKPPRQKFKKKRLSPEELEEKLRLRVTTMKEGDNVLLRLPSDAIKAVVVSKHG
jgi:tRNA (adenine58-N1)-methyltransferase non-catalytic subunit